MKFQADLELREAVFRKMGYKRTDDSHKVYWIKPDDEESKLFLDPLPPIETSWEVCADLLVPFMRGECYQWSIDPKGWFCWTFYETHLPTGDPEIVVEKYDCKGKQIINDNIARAACEAFLEVEI